MLYFLWALQILILTAGIHLFLRFVRTTRGNRLIRGLFVSVMVGVVGLWGLSTALELEELRHLLEGSTGFIVIGLAIVFQPELRRGISRLGRRSFSGRLSGTSSEDTVREIVLAARSMSARREGALIAIECESSLATVVETGTEINAAVRARLIESLFRSGGALHDGAVVVRKDRIAAAGCILPLAEETQLDPSLGTRHRAALGLTEEGDAVVLVVSEETGSISLAHEGKLSANVAPSHVQETLLSLLESSSSGRGPTKKRILPLTVALKRDFAWLAGSLLLAMGVWFAAHQNISDERDYRVRIVDGGATRRAPEEGEIRVYLPVENVRLRAPATPFVVQVTGSRSQFDELGSGLRGTLEIDDPDWNGGPVSIDAIRWEDSVLGLQYAWNKGQVPELVVERFGSKRVQLRPGDVVVETDRLNPYFQKLEVSFEPSPSLEITGPKPGIDDLGEASNPILLRPIVLSEGDRGEVRERVALDPSLVEGGFSITSPVDVVVPVVPVHRTAGSIEKEIALVCLSPDRNEELSNWRLPANVLFARFRVETSGLIPIDADQASAALQDRKTAILQFVRDNLRVYVDVAELPPRDEGRSVPIRWTGIDRWRESPEALGLEEGTLSDWEELEIHLESEQDILLEPRPRTPGAEEESS